MIGIALRCGRGCVSEQHSQQASGILPANQEFIPQTLNSKDKLLSNLVNDLYGYRRIETGERDPKPLTLNGSVG